MAFLKKSGRLGGSKSKVSTDSDLAADWMAQGSSSSSSSQTTQDAAAAGKRREEAEAEAEADRRRLLNVNRYAAGGGGGGAAAFTKIRKQEQSRVEKMQNQTFTRWVNLQLTQQSGSRAMLDLVQGLASGENLLRLLAVLSGKNPSAQTATSTLSSSVASGSKEVGARRANQPNLGGVGSRFQSLGNMEQAFKFMKEEGIPLIGIGPQDISQGNLKLILGMMWSIIQHYRLVNLFDNEQQATQEKTTSTSSASSTPATDKKSDAGEGKEGKVADVAENAGSAKVLDSPPATNGAAEPSTSAAAAAMPAAAVGADEAVVDDKGKKGKKDDKKKAKEDKKEQQAKEKERKKAEEEEKKAAKKEQQDNKKAKAPEALAAKPDEAKKTAQVAASATAAPVARSVQPQQQSVESSLLEWVREKLTAAAPEGEKLHVGNVKELFADGRALPFLVNAIQPGSVDVKALDVKRPVENNKLALRVATEKLAVPALIEGDDLANGADVDGLSLILYLSYLKQADAGKAQAKEAAVEVEKKQPKDDGKQGEGRNATDAEVEAKPEVEKSEAKKDSESNAKAQEQPRKNEAEKSVAETKVETRVNEVAVAERKEEQKAATEAHAAPGAESEPTTKRPPASAAAPSADSPVAAAVAVSEKSEDRGLQDQAPAKDVASPAAVAPNGADDTAKEAAVTAVTAQAKNEGGEAAGPEAEEEESKGGKKKKKEKKEKPGKKKTKKSKDPANGEENGDGSDKKSKKKLKKLKKKTSSLAPKHTDEAVGQTASPAPEATVASTSPSPKEAEALPAKKVIAPLPHSRLPARTGEDLSYLVGGSAPVKKPASLQLAAIPERKKPAPPAAVSPDVDPVSAFWYS